MLARWRRSGCRRATSLPAGSTRASVPYLSLYILPTATAMLKPDVPVSYAVIVMLGGNFTCATADDVATDIPASAMAARFIIGLINSIPPLAADVAASKTPDPDASSRKGR